MLSIDFFFDSNIIVEGFKGNEEATNIIIDLKTISSKRIYINEVVWSETVYQLCIKRALEKNNVFSFLNRFFFLNIEDNVIRTAEKLIMDYNLTPNDALILATCKNYNIEYLVSLDVDFEGPCKNEGVGLINSKESLKNLIKPL